MDWEEMESVKVLAFDVFGTVVDWHSALVREIEAMSLDVDSNEFALAWRAGYRPAMDRVTSGELGWMKIDALHRIILDELLDQFEVRGLSDAQKAYLNKAWHRLDAWPEVIGAMNLLKEKFILTTLSNGNISLLTNMAKFAGLPWDCILSAETFKHYKPEPETYLGVAELFDVSPGQVMMVAAHHDDLAGARACGLKTAYIERPDEFGPSVAKDVSPKHENTLHCTDLSDLADQLNCVR